MKWHEQKENEKVYYYLNWCKKHNVSPWGVPLVAMVALIIALACRSCAVTMDANSIDNGDTVTANAESNGNASTVISSDADMYSGDIAANDADHGDAVSGGVDGEEVTEDGEQAGTADAGPNGNGAEQDGTGNDGDSVNSGGFIGFDFEDGTENSIPNTDNGVKVMKTAYNTSGDRKVPDEALGKLSETTIMVPFFIGDSEMALGTCTFDSKNGVNRILVTDELNFTLYLDGTITKYCDGLDDGHSHRPEWGLPNGKVLQAYAGRGIMITDGYDGKFVGNKHPNQVPVFTSPESYYFAVPVKGLADGLGYHLERKAPTYDANGKVVDPGYIRLTKGNGPYV